MDPTSAQLIARVFLQKKYATWSGQSNARWTLMTQDPMQFVILWIAVGRSLHILIMRLLHPFYLLKGLILIGLLIYARLMLYKYFNNFILGRRVWHCLSNQSFKY